MDGKVSIVLILLGVVLAQHMKADPSRSIPNPFDRKFLGYYAIKGDQIIESHKPKQNISFESYFSYVYGFSYTIFTDNNDDDTLGHAILTDNVGTGKIYIIRNPKEDANAITDCELDNVHHHKHVFPWLYNVQYSNKSRHASIYGPFAIWMNLIDKAPKRNDNYPDFDVWTVIHNRDLVRVAFDKDQPKYFEVFQTYKTQNADDPDKGYEHYEQADHYDIKSFTKVEIADLVTDKLSGKSLSRMYRQLRLCRNKRIKHRLFPDLANYLTNSPHKMFYIEYHRQTFPLFEQESSYDPYRNRYSSKNDTVVEVLSMMQEAQSVEYRTSSETEVKRDKYLKLFTVNALKEHSPSADVRQNDSATGYYHIFERKQLSDNTSFYGCFIGDREPSNKHKIFTRPVHFTIMQKQITGHMSGLIAILSNAARIHYKEFKLDTRKLVHSQTRQVIYADEWIIHDETSSWDIHFYFKQLYGEDLLQRPNETPIDRLLTVDIRDANVAITDAPRELHIDYNLKMRFFILKVDWELDELVVDDIFKVPDTCVPVVNQDDDAYETTEDSAFESSDDDLASDDDSELESADSSDDTDEENEYEHKEIVDEGFELDQGTISEYSRRLPNPTADYIASTKSFELELEISMMRANSSAEPSKIFLTELHIPEHDSLTISIYLAEDLLKERKPHITYHFRYKSDALFRVNLINTTQEYCAYIDDVDEEWLRLLSKSSVYRVELPEHIIDQHFQRVSIRSLRLMRYGLGAIWDYATSPGGEKMIEFRGRGKHTLKLPDESEYLPVHWSLKERDVAMDFNFLYNVTKHKENKAQGKHHAHGETILHFESLDIKGNTGAGSFRPVQIRVLKFYTDHLDQTSTTLPETCRNRISEAHQALVKRYKLTVPMFEDFAGKEHSYHADYEVVGSYSVQRIVEMFDQDGRGWIRVQSGQENKTVLQRYIERARGVAFDYDEATKQCALKTMDQTHLELVPGIECDTDKFNPNKLLGLGALWSKLTEEPLELRVYHYINTLRIEYVKNTHLGEVLLQTVMVFLMKHGLSESIELEHIYSYLNQTRTLIIVNSFNRDVVSSELPPLPDSCARLIEDKDGPTLAPEQESTPTDKAQYSREHFPRLTPHLKDKILMRSEIEIKYSQDQQASVVSYLLEEWYDRAGGVRVKSYDFNGRNMDLLIYPRTEEYFDLSTPYKCENRLPVLEGVSEDESDNISESKLARFWSDDNTTVDHLSNLYYGALGLWRLAEKNLDHVELEQTFAASTAHRDGKSVLFLGIEVWRVNIPGSDYLLHTAKFQNENMTWSILETIVIMGKRRQVTIEVVNYRYDYQLSDLSEHFSLPVGHGCKRSDVAVDEMSRAEDVFDLDFNRGFILAYEASLEIVKQNDAQGSSSRRLLPTYSGELIHVGRIGKRNFDVVGQISQVEYAQEGTLEESKRIVSTRLNGARYNIDLNSGHCRLEELDYSSYSEDTAFVLEFPDEDGPVVYSIKVSMNTQYNKKFWFDESRNRILNRVAYEDYDYSIYEQSNDYLELSKELKGRAAVMRFFYADTDISVANRRDGKLIRKHDEMHTRVMIFDDQTGSKLKAILNLSLYRLPKSTTSDLLKSISVAECFADQDLSSSRKMGLFKISYPQIEADDDSLADIFYEKLINAFYIDLDQLDGKAQVSINHRQDSTEIHFNMWEPSSLESFAFYKETTMHEQFEHAADSFPTDDLKLCLGLCQFFFDCVAISYCERDQVCKFITRASLDRQPDIVRYELQMAQPRQGCLYYYRRALDKFPLTLGNFSYVLDQYVNSVRSADQLQALSLRIGDDKFIEPIKFEDLTEDTGGLEWQLDGAIYGEQEDNYKLDLKKLEQLNSERGTHFEVLKKDAMYIHDCMNECRMNDCVYLSHCKRGRICVMITNGSDIQSLRTGVRIEADKAEGCAVVVKEVQHNYDLYNDTSAPTVWTKRLEDYTAAECASACESEGNNCLSFDYCKFIGHVSTRDICLLQSDHMAMDNIQRDILGPSLQDDVNQIDDKDVYCQHYAKSLLIDFDRLPKSKLKTDKWNYQTIRGLSARKCAAICIQDDCQAFEYCVLGNVNSRAVTQSCRFPKSTLDEGIDTIQIIPIEDTLQCIVYNRTQSSKDESLQHTLHWDSLIDMQADIGQYTVSSYWIYSIYLFVAVVVGSIVQIIHVKTRGNSLLFH